MNIAYLRTHSYFGLLDSLLSPAELVQAASQKGIQALALTDFQYLTGAVEFYEACLAAGIQPILGVELDLCYHNQVGRITLLAKDTTGWSTLSRLSSSTLITGAPIDIRTLSSHNTGVIYLEGGHNSILKKLMNNTPNSQRLPERFLEEIKSLFEADGFIEIQRFTSGPLRTETMLISLARQFDLPLIASQPIHYLEPKDQSLFRTITAISQNKTIQELQDSDFGQVPLHFPEKGDFIHRFQDLPEALNNITTLTEKCTFELPIGKLHYPNFPTPNGLTQAEFLHQRAYQGAERLYPQITPQIRERLDYELAIITEMGYEPIFLIMEDVLAFARLRGIPTSSRGSAASSLVAHCLNITSPDPLALNLYFERFLNPARNKPPDIDTDIASHRREEVIQYVFQKYQPDHVAMVGTINRYRPKSAFSDVAKAYGLSAETIRQLSKRLPSSYRFQSGSNSTDAFSALIRQGSIPLINDIVRDAQALLEKPRHLSVHPGGIVIAPFPITDLIPIMHSPSLGINHAQFDLDGVEKFGLVKIDLLGIRGLTILGEVAEQVHIWHQREYKNGLQVLEQIPLDDPETADTVINARTIGCFQIESPGMRATLREINAKSVEDIMAALALYRPGPLKGGLRDAFVHRFRGEEPVTHIHDALTELLSDTLGVILYQEQVLRIAHELGALSIAEADILRRAMSHFDPGGMMITLRNNFVAGAISKSGVPQETAERIWEMMAAFAGYGFPKAHAASYAQLAWQSAWCKTHYPAEFMCAVLGYGGGYYSQRVYLMEARRLGLTVKPPHINHSDVRFKVTYPNGAPEIYMGLSQVRDLTKKTIRAILNQRPFLTFEDFFTRIDLQEKEMRHLIMCGAFEGLITIPAALKQIEHKIPLGQMQLFTPTQPDGDWDMTQRSKAELEILGISLQISPLEQYSDQIQAANAITTLEAVDMIGQKIIVAGMRQTIRRLRNKSNQMMAYLTLEDFEGSLSVIIPPEVLRKYDLVLREVGPFLVEGIIEKDQKQGSIKMFAETIHLLR